MADNGAGGRELQWLGPAQTTFDTLETAGVQELKHQCLDVGFLLSPIIFREPIYIERQTAVSFGFWTCAFRRRKDVSSKIALPHA